MSECVRGTRNGGNSDTAAVQVKQRARYERREDGRQKKAEAVDESGDAQEKPGKGRVIHLRLHDRVILYPA